MWWSRLPCLLALLLAGCGFQAMGTAEFPPGLGAIYVESGNRYSPFYQELTTAVRASDATLAASAAAADTVIRVLRDDTGQRVLTVSPRNVPREYEVFYIVAYEVVTGGQRAFTPQTLSRTRAYTYDETQVLGKAEEEESLRRALARDLVNLIVRRLEVVD